MMSQKNKNILLIVGFLVAVIISYQLAFSKTLTAKKEVTLLREKTVGVENLTQHSKNLFQREKFVDSVLSASNFKNSSVQNNLLEFLNSQSTSKGFAIVGFKEPHRWVENNITATSYQFTLRGNFDDLLNTVYQIEQQYNFGEISHIAFEKKRDYRKGKSYLECFVVIESFISK